MKKYILFTVLFLGALTVQSQEITAHVGVGLSNLSYSSSKASNSGGLGFQLGVQYRYKIDPMFSVISGLEFAMYNSTTKLKDGVYTSNEVDENTSAFEYKVATKGYTEKQQFNTLNVPILFQARFENNTNMKFYANGGFKVHIPVGNTFKANSEAITTTGYYPNLKLELDNIENKGFGTLTNFSEESRYNDVKTAVSVTLEGGAIFNINQGELYAGAYIDYGITSMYSADNQRNILNYKPTDVKNVKPNGVFNLNKEINPKLLMFGLQVKYAFSSAVRKTIY